jgi:hypothetical protein
MAHSHSLLVISDIHYASEAERRRGRHELGVIRNPALRLGVAFYRRYLWLRDPFAHNGLLERALTEVRDGDWVIANGDYSCDTAFVGVSDAAAFASAEHCLNRLRARGGDRLRAVLGDHELGKVSLFGGVGGLRLASWRVATERLGLQPLWRLELGRYVLVGVTSSLVALPVYEPEALPAELPAWRRLRQAHLAEVRCTFDGLERNQRVILFVHDPTALPFLWAEPSLRERANQIERTVIGHLHSEVVLFKARLLAGMPAIRFLGNAARRMSEALREARSWRPFRVLLCPSLAGIELTKRGGVYRVHLDPEGRQSPQFEFVRIRR